MNIVEAYIKIKGQLVILISGLSGSGKTFIGKNLSTDFKINFFDESDYCVQDYDKKIKIGDQEVIDWDNDEIYDWNKINDVIENNSKEGLVFCGTAFPKEKIKHKIDFHINIKLNKNNLFMIREKFIKEKDCAVIHEDLVIRSKIFKDFTYKYNDELIKRSIIDKQINGNNYVDDLDNYNEKIYDEVFKYLISKIEKILYNQ